MNKFYGNVGFIEYVEIEPGYWDHETVEHKYYGDWIKFSGKFRVNSDSTNDDKDVASTLSIVADPYAEQHFSDLRYVEFGGKQWKVTAIELQYPRLILTIGGLYNGKSKQAETA